MHFTYQGDRRGAVIDRPSRALCRSIPHLKVISIGQNRRMAYPLRFCRPVYDFLVGFSVYIASNEAQLLNEVPELNCRQWLHKTVCYHTACRNVL